MDEKVSYCNGCVIAMQGKDCVAISTDRRLSLSSYTIGEDFEKIFNLAPRLYVGVTGLQADILTVQERLGCRRNVYEINTNSLVTPKIVTELLSHMLYQHRFAPFHVESIVAGMDPYTLEPYLCNMDLLGWSTVSSDFVVVGTCTEQMIGTCESLWEPNMDADRLFEAISRAMISAGCRDTISGCGMKVYLIEHDKVTVRLVKTRMD
ncbi:hypothetical protein AWZ03_004748 [Drosophila navojoa]|uniref:Uncharacterized protein n=1 Tax=Drosophila navojoa TaxID=7232 RepID=A0A484BLY0_DRONA|nr:proteasome subunit beta type-3-like [Drosophila navojoa]TDG48845.1 hypothetical protein AWZ03_004748 [Drosophila navojoa]